jgi:hypothetical protein
MLALAVLVLLLILILGKNRRERSATVPFEVVINEEETACGALDDQSRLIERLPSRLYLGEQYRFDLPPERLISRFVLPANLNL